MKRTDNKPEMNSKLRSVAMMVLASGFLAIGCTREEPEEATSGSNAREERTLPVRGVSVDPRDLSRTVQISAPVEPLRTIRLASRTSGVLTEVLVEEGDPVSSGQILARIDVSEQQAELARARASRDERRTSFERLERLRDQDYVDAASYEAARAELSVADSEVDLWQTRVDFGTVRSSIDGTVVSRYVEPGEAIGQHEPLFSLADLANVVVRVGVSELDVRNLHIGQNVLVRLDAAAGENPIQGLIRRIFPAAEQDSRLITVEIDLPDAQQVGIRPGFLARAELLVDSMPDVLAVPAASIARRDDAYYVMRIDGEDRLERREIVPGVTRGSWRQIQSGLESGDRIVASNPLELNEGARVRIVGWET